MINIVDDLLQHINTMSKATFEKINKYDKTVDIGGLIIIFIGAGGEGIIYGYDKYAIKFYKINNGFYAQKYSNKGNSKELFILNESSKLVDNNITNTFLKVYRSTKIFNLSVVIMDLVNGDLNSWVETKHTDIEWENMIFQILYGTYVMQKCLKLYHHDMGPKNLLFKRLDTPSTIKYTIKSQNVEHIFTVTSKIIFIISDFGQASTLLVKHNVYNPESIQLSIDNNLDLVDFSIFHNRLAVSMLKNIYTLNDLLKIGGNDQRFISYYKKRLLRSKKHNSCADIDSQIFKALGYYLIEKKIINIEDIPNPDNNIFLPSKKIQTMLKSLGELKGKNALLNKIIEIGNSLNELNKNATINLCV